MKSKSQSYIDQAVKSLTESIYQYNRHGEALRFISSDMKENLEELFRDKLNGLLDEIEKGIEKYDYYCEDGDCCYSDITSGLRFHIKKLRGEKRNE